MSFQNLNTLRHFDAAARHLNLRAAAQELQVTQGAVSQQIKFLEEILQVSLFTRHPRGMALTEAGERLHRPVSDGLSMIFDGIAKLKSFSDRIVLSIPPSLAARWLAPRLARSAQDHDDLDLQILPSARVPRFGRDGVDMAICLGPAPVDPSLQATLLAPIRMVAVTGPSLMARAPVLARPSFFAQYPLIEDQTHPWQSWFAREAPGTAFDRLEFTQTALALEAAEEGHGIALVPDVLVGDALKRGHLVKLREDPAEEGHGVYLLQPAKAPDRRAAQAVVDWIRAAF